MQQARLWELLSDYVLQWIGLAVAVLVLVGLIIRIRTLFRKDADAAADEHQLLTSISELHREGDLSEEEYRSIKGRLISRLGDRPRDEQ